MNPTWNSVYQSDTKSLKLQIRAARKVQRRAAKELWRRAERGLQMHRNVHIEFPGAQPLKARKTHSFCRPENSLYLKSSSKARNRPRQKRDPSLDEPPILPVEPAEPVSHVEPVSYVETQVKAGLNKDRQSIQLARATSEDTEMTEVETPQMETGATEGCPIMLDDDSGEDTDTEDEDEAGKAIPSKNHPEEDIDAEDGQQPITNDDGSENMDTEGPVEGTDADAGEQPIIYGGSKEDMDTAGQEQPVSNDDDFEDMDAEGSEEDVDNANEQHPISNDAGFEDMDAEGSEEDMDTADQQQPTTTDNGSEGTDAEGSEEATDEGVHPDAQSKRNARRSQLSQHLDDMVDWTSAAHKENIEDMFRMEWVTTQKLWAETTRICVVEKHTNFCRRWEDIQQGLLPVLRRFGKALVRLQELEAERESGAITMGDGDENDDDYVPKGRSARKS
ncbi:hypothetical protein PMIN01_11939 [Paraphaeosphaeria minitans]|uniref:Uncharacterized protein n=1 Tax=Paraphaeosphaeria minitans TaxID=565426 RepID=A0A9P6G7F7_9PLEO|nr:hypothetical protein PMIN01_11939 [Paraphaeosphaeria minitans]